MTAEKMMALLPCPFCGGPAGFEECAQGSSVAPTSCTWTVGCMSEEADCIAYQMMATFNRKCEAAEAWNTRASAVGAGAREALPRWRHKKRGTTYSEIGRGKMQAFESALDMEPVVIYRSDADGSLWVRPTNEFEDGRFEAALQSEPVQPAGSAQMKP